MRISRAVTGIGLIEVATLVIYDIVEDRTRLKVSEMCLDFGLERIQYSAFAGRLNRNRREELCLKLQKLLAKESASGRIRVQPMCERDFRDGWEIEMVAGLPEDEACEASRRKRGDTVEAPPAADSGTRPEDGDAHPASE